MLEKTLEEIAGADLGDASMLAYRFLAAVDSARIWREIADADRLLRMLILEHGFSVRKAAAAWQEAAGIVSRTKNR